jgi:hypothetical protein
MPMKDEDKTELKTLFSEAVVDAMETFRSKTEEAAAKAQQEETEKKKNESGNDDKGAGTGFSLRGFLLGE